MFVCACVVVCVYVWVCVCVCMCVAYECMCECVFVFMLWVFIYANRIIKDYSIWFIKNYTLLAWILYMVQSWNIYLMKGNSIVCKNPPLSWPPIVYSFWKWNGNFSKKKSYFSIDCWRFMLFYIWLIELSSFLVFPLKGR